MISPHALLSGIAQIYGVKQSNKFIVVMLEGTKKHRHTLAAIPNFFKTHANSRNICPDSF